jgi:phosphoglycerol transferase MdoB-like AlkP superfamily enzyme
MQSIFLTLLFVPIIWQTISLVKYSPIVNDRAWWKWGIIYSLGVLQTLFLELLVVAFLYALSSLFYFSVLLTVVSYLLLDFVNIQLLQERSMVFLPNDLKMAAGFRELMGMVKKSKLVGMAILVLAGIFGAVLLEVGLGSPALIWWLRLSVIFVVGIIFLQFFRLNHPTTLAYKVFRWHWKDHPYHFNQVFGAQVNGFLLQFLVNIDLSIMTEPQNYTADTMRKIEDRYRNLARNLNQERRQKPSDETVVFVLSESLSDPLTLNDVELTTDVLKNIHALESESVTFQMASGYVGGGTANIEYEAYTGFSNALFEPAMATPYAQVVPNQANPKSIADHFQDAVGVHTFTGNLYQRDLVYEAFGFSKFYTTNSRTNPVKHLDTYEYGKYISDEAFFAELADKIEVSAGGGFISGISMQNHMPFTSAAEKGILLSSGPYHVENKAYDAYLTGIQQTDEAIGRFLAGLKKQPRPITVLLYGDHLPNLFSADDATGKYPMLRVTPGFIWQNDAATQIDGPLKSAGESLVGSNTLGPYLYQVKNWQVTPFFAFLQQIINELPVLVNELVPGEKLGFLTATGRAIIEKELSQSQRALLSEYRLIQYDQTAGNGYLSDNFFNQHAE